MRRAAGVVLCAGLLVMASACGAETSSVSGSASSTSYPARSKRSQVLKVDEYRAARPGQLPADGAASVGGVALPAGHQIHAEDVQTRGRASEAVLWMSDEILADAGTRWVELRRAFPETGLWPLVLESLEGQPDRPWVDGEFYPPGSTSPDQVNVAATLDRWWNEAVPLPEEDDPEVLAELLPFDRRFPGLAPASGGAIDEHALDRVARGMSGRIGLVPVTRPADVVAVLGWSGPANYFDDEGPLSAVLRSWEDRFGAEPIALGFDTLTVGVRRPPTTASESLRLAAEQFAVCPDNVSQGVGSITDLARAIDRSRRWDFWWD